MPQIETLALAWERDGGPALYVFDVRGGSGVRLANAEMTCPFGDQPDLPSCVPPLSEMDAGLTLTACHHTTGRHLVCPVFARGALEAALVTSAFDNGEDHSLDLRAIELRRMLVRISWVMQLQLERAPLADPRLAMAE
ncbi:MAG: hypothetical protein JST92_22620 [Deltaproteobacteria bacterium]|nr:hypothetical protein [Deltaproteobacteria bacterium]